MSQNKCISKCYPKSTYYIHPWLLEPLVSNDHQTCAIIPTKVNGQRILMQECTSGPDTDNFIFDYHIDSKEFLEITYNILNFPNMISYLHKNKLLEDTNVRIQEMSWLAFGQDYEKVQTVIFDYYLFLFNNDWNDWLVEKINEQYNLSGDLVVEKPFFYEAMTNFIKDSDMNKMDSVIDEFKNYILQQLIEHLTKV